MARKCGFELLADQIAEHLVCYWEENGPALAGDSPIERLLYAALRYRIDLGGSEFYELFVRYTKAEAIKAAEEKSEVLRLVVWPQAEVSGRRIDFLFFVQDHRSKNVHALAVECDGHEFHERTKDQVAKDKRKDRRATLSGLETLRFSGSEIWNDPWGCVDDITMWALKKAAGCP